MFRIGDKAILRELKKANITEKDFIKSIKEQGEEDIYIVFDNDGEELITFDYREYLKQKSKKLKDYRPKRLLINNSTKENTIDTSFLDVGIEDIN